VCKDKEKNADFRMDFLDFLWHQFIGFQPSLANIDRYKNKFVFNKYKTWFSVSYLIYIYLYVVINSEFEVVLKHDSNNS